MVGVDGSVAARMLGSEVGFVKTFAQAFIYRRLPGRGVVMAAGARLGVAVGFAHSVAPPLEIVAADGQFARAVDRGERVSDDDSRPAGERTVLRRWRHHGPRFRARSAGHARRRSTRRDFRKAATAWPIFNLETRAPYWKNLQFVWFLDAGNVFKLASDIRLDELRFTSGVGFRYRSPIGPLRVDWGWKLSTQLLLDRRTRALERAAHFAGAGILMRRCAVLCAGWRGRHLAQLAPPPAGELIERTLALVGRQVDHPERRAGRDSRSDWSRPSHRRSDRR